MFRRVVILLVLPLVISGFLTGTAFASFSAVSVEWEGPEDHIDVQFNDGDKWSEWYEMHADIDGPKIAINQAFIATNPSIDLRYRGPENTKFTYYQTENRSFWKSLVASISSLDNLADALKLDRDKLNIISRARWGADESYRIYTGTAANPPLIDLSENLLKFADEIKLTKTVATKNGKKLIWPIEYPEKMRKIIVHHTATTKDLEDPEQAVRNIYKWHAIDRGWGDIGYNYVIDQNGNIYEGRFGGETVVGGHAGPGNIGSIGIALLGDYTDTKVPSKAMSSLIRLVAEKSRIHNIDPDGFSSFRGEIMPNVFGHRDIMSTDCPGEKLYALIPVIRGLAKKLTISTTVSNIRRLKSNRGYDFEDESGILFVEMNPTEEKEITIRFKNTGEKTWGKGTFVVVNNNPAFDNVVSFPDKKDAQLAQMQESEAKSGRSATFKVKFRSGIKSDLIYLNIAPVVDGKTKLSKYLVLPLLLANADYSYEVVSSEMPPAFMQAGSKFDGYVNIKNTGNVVWPGSGENRVVLGADDERDRVSLFADPQGPRLGYLIGEKVKPGETGKFLLRLKAPKEPGYYTEHFTPLIEGITWFENMENSFRTFVYEHKYSSKIVDSVPSKQIGVNTTRTMWIKLRNMGGVSWSRKDFSAIFKSSSRIGITNIDLTEEIVKPGETATITFAVNAPSKVGKIFIYLRPRIQNANIYKTLIKFPVTILKNLTANNSKGDDIRIKLSFGEEPNITADGAYSVFDGEQKLASLVAGEIVKVEKLGASYRLSIPSAERVTVRGPVRFIPEGKSILEISNFENRPTWNPALNDNRYRGILEIQRYNGNLVIINELSVEDYLKGLAENANGENAEKMKALLILARSYAVFYVREAEKFLRAPYHLDDDPQISQKYLGYGYELRSNNNAKAVLATRGKVVKYGGKIIKTPYFSSSDGRTRSAQEVWGWTDAPYLQSVPDPYCDGISLKGHGVGMSGCGARGMAAAGKTYQEIIEYYFKGVEISKIY